MSAGRMLQPRGVSGPIARQQTAVLYSANKIPTTSGLTGDQDYFTVAVGSQGQGFSSTNLTYTETNLTNARRIADQSAWLITSFGFYVSNQAALSDTQKILENGNLWIEKPGFQYRFGPPFLWPAGVGISGVAATTANATTHESWSNGVAHRGARMPLRSPIILQPGETFAFHLTLTTATTLGTATVTYVVLYGENRDEIVQ